MSRLYTSLLIVLSVFTIISANNTFLSENDLAKISNLKEEKTESKDISESNEFLSKDEEPSNKMSSISLIEEKSDISSKENSSDKNFWRSFVSGFSLIFASEIGDKTFILSLFYALRIGILITFLTASTTLVLLNAFWLLVGASLPLLLYQTWINWLAVVLFFVFAVVLFIDGMRMDDKLIIDEFHEYEVEAEIEKEVEEKEYKLREKLLKEEKKTHSHLNKILEKERLGHQLTNEETIFLNDEKNKDKPNNDTTKPSSIAKSQSFKSVKSNKSNASSIPPMPEKSTFSIVWGFSISLILAECGDRSQITAVAIAAVYNFSGVLLGSSIAHIAAALIAVSIGHYFSAHVSEKLVTLIGSGLFFLYSIDALYECLSA